MRSWLVNIDRLVLNQIDSMRESLWRIMMKRDYWIQLSFCNIMITVIEILGISRLLLDRDNFWSKISLSYIWTLFVYDSNKMIMLLSPQVVITNIVGDSSWPWMIRVQMGFLKDHIMEFKENEKFLPAVFFWNKSLIMGWAGP